MSRFVTRRFSRFTGVGVAPLTIVPLSTHRLTEQERQGILAEIRSLKESRDNPRTGTPGRSTGHCVAEL